MKVIVYKTEDGVSVITPVADIPLTHALHLTVPSNAEYVVINDGDLPDGYFRDAWEISNNAVVVNVERAKNLQYNFWRVSRSRKLKELDYQFMIALETDNKNMIERIKLKKTALRDITKIELPDSVLAIKNTWPEILNDDTSD